MHLRLFRVDLARGDFIHEAGMYDESMVAMNITLLLLYAIPSFIMLDSLKQKKYEIGFSFISFGGNTIFSWNSSDSRI